MRAMMRSTEPDHPGGFVKGKVIEANGLSVTDAAQALGVTRPAFSALINGRSHLTREVALRIEKAFGVSMDQVMRMQNSFDIADVRKRGTEIGVARFEPRVIRTQRERNS